MTYARTRATADSLSRHAPAEIRAYEISGGRITFPVRRSRRHALNAIRIRQELDRCLPHDLVAHNGGEVEDVSLGILRRPDVIVVPTAAFSANTLAPFHPTEVPLIAEVVSPSNPTTAYVHKLHDYAAMGIERYLLIDPRTSTLTRPRPRRPPLPRPPRLRLRRRDHCRPLVPPDHRPAAVPAGPTAISGVDPGSEGKVRSTLSTP